MPDPDLFALTHRQLTRTKDKTLLFFLGTAVFLAAAWLIWLFCARVAVYVSTDRARVEAEQAIYPVEAAVSGRVVKTHLALGRQVRKGDVLAELEADAEDLRVSEERIHRASLEAQRKIFESQLGWELAAVKQQRVGGQAAVDEARVHLQEAREAAALAQDELEKDRTLYKEKLTSQIALRRSESNAAQKLAEAEASASALRQATSQVQGATGEQLSRIEAIKSDIARLDGEISASESTQQQLTAEAESYVVRAPASGQLGSVETLKPGTFIHQGDRLAAIIPRGPFRIVASFQPNAVIGRVHPGQIAHLKLAGFPAAQYGTITATVSSVASEARDGWIRVELEPRPNHKLHLQHGLPGTLDIAVDRVSPFALLLRQPAGLTTPVQPPQAQSTPR